MNKQKNRKTIISIVVSILLLIIAFFLVTLFRNQYVSQDVITIYVPKTTIPDYTIISFDMLETKAFHNSLLVNNDYAIDSDDIVGKITTETLAMGLPIANVFLANPKDYRGADPSLDIVSIPIDPKHSVGSLIKEGQYVDLYLGQTVQNENDFAVSSIQKLGEVLVVSTMSSDGRLAGNVNSSDDIYYPVEIIDVAVSPNSTPYLLQALTMAETCDKCVFWVTLSDTPNINNHVVSELQPIVTESPAESE